MDKHTPDILSKSVADAKQKYTIALKELENYAQIYNAESLFVSLIANLAYGPASIFSESTHGTIPAKIEILAFYFYPHFSKSSNIDYSPIETNRCIELLDDVFTTRNFLMLFENASSKSRDPVERIISHAILSAHTIRGSAYPSQTTEEIMEIQGRFTKYYAESLGLCPIKAQRCFWNIIHQSENQLNTEEIQKFGQWSIKSMANAWKNAKLKVKKDGVKLDEDERLVLQVFQNKNHAAIYGMIDAINKTAMTALPVRYDDIQQKDTSISREEWNKLLEIFGFTTDVRNKIKDIYEVRKFPLYVLSENKVVVVEISNGLDILWMRYEEFIKQSQKFFERYQKHKSTWVENKVIKYLQRIFPSGVYRKLSYPDIEKDDGSIAELDVLILWGQFLVLIEIKSKQFRMETHLGDIGRLKTDLKENIKDAFYQAKRAWQYIETTSKPEFTEISTGRKISIPKDQILRKYLITISQHHLGGFATKLADLKELNLFGHNEYPISFSISDLDVISEFTKYPAVFLHYIERRLDTEKEDVYILSDELEYFGAYLTSRLRKEKFIYYNNVKVGCLLLTGFQEDFDKWQKFKLGCLDTAPEIKLNVPEEIHIILKELSRRDDDNAKWIAFSLLSMSDKSLHWISRAMKDYGTLNIPFGNVRSLTHQDGNTVIVLLATSGNKDQLRKSTIYRATIEKYRRKAKRVIGLGTDLTSVMPPFDCAYWEEEEWKYEENLDKILREEPQRKAFNMKRHPQRNKPCFCGSGKKFKKCCRNLFYN